MATPARFICGGQGGAPAVFISIPVQHKGFDLLQIPAAGAEQNHWQLFGQYVFEEFLGQISRQAEKLYNLFVCRRFAKVSQQHDSINMSYVILVFAERFRVCQDVLKKLDQIWGDLFSELDSLIHSFMFILAQIDLKSFKDFFYSVFSIQYQS